MAPMLTSTDSDYRHPGFLCVAVSVSFLIFATGLDVTITAAVAVTVGEHFGDTSSSLYLSTTTLLFSTVAAPLFAQLADMRGRSFATTIACLFFAWGALTCAYAPTMSVALLGRSLSGFGTGGISILSSVILSETVPLKSRALWHSVGKLIAMAIGGPIGGVLADKIHWRAAFVLEIPLALASLLVAGMFLKDPSQPIKPDAPDINLFHHKSKLDVGGCILLPVMIAPLLLGSSILARLIGAPKADPQEITSILVLGVVAIVATVMFCFHESSTINPIISTRLLRHRNIGVTCVLQFLSAFVHHSILSLAPILAVVIGRTSAALAGMHIMPVSLAAVLATLLAGLHINRTGKCRSMLLFGAFCVVIGPVAFVYNLMNGKAFGGVVLQVMCSFPSTFGFQLINSVSMVVLLAVHDSTEIANITSHASLFKSLGGVMGTSLSAVVMQIFLSLELTRTIAGGDRKYLPIFRVPGRDWSFLPLPVQAMGYSCWQTAFVYVFGMLGGISVLNLAVTALGVSELNIGSSGAQ